MNSQLQQVKLVAPLAVLLAGTVLFIGASSSESGKNVPKEKPEGPEPTIYQDVTKATGIAFTYKNGEEGGHFAILDSLGGGVALIDYDGDGLLDIFVAGGGHYAGKDK